MLSAPRVQRLLLRAAVFLVPASALWALLPLVASGRLGLGASGYGVLLGVLGVGALAGVALLPWLRTHLSLGAVLAASSLVFGIATAGSAVLGYLALAPLLALAGVAWIMTLSTVNAALQLTLPAWVRARGLSVYLLVMSGSQAVGAAAWGWVATVWGVATTLYVAAAALLLAALSLWWWPVLPGTAQLRRGISERLVDEPPAWAAGAGRVWIDVAYVTDVADHDAVARILALETVRRRTGASQWYVVADADGAILRERYQFETWDEYARQERERLTDEDRALIDRAAAGATEVSTSVEFAVGQR
ncbi:hypothetical protein G7070_11635 [Propioniciclava coleopterorum]|uniref:Transmembrane secretion effector n=1 Tax=Propioniciclava coleopterorum TaxID=2714937 RepID=A0A6G7Y800_9ACTN|nr:hypothetical protein G7070_11635 [Propioniciclava coleopterorum]